MRAGNDEDIKKYLSNKWKECKIVIEEMKQKDEQLLGKLSRT